MIEPYCPMTPAELESARAFQDWLNRGAPFDELEPPARSGQLELFVLPATAQAADPRPRASKAVRA